MEIVAAALSSRRGLEHAAAAALSCSSFFNVKRNLLKKKIRMGCTSSMPVVNNRELAAAYSKSRMAEQERQEKHKETREEWKQDLKSMLTTQKSSELLGIPVGTPPKALKRL